MKRMKNLLVLIIALVVVFGFACSNKTSNSEESYQGHKVEVKEVVYANSYTYLNVTENEEDFWIAIPKMVANVGATYYYDGALEMKNFESKDLNRVFETVYFVERVSEHPATTASAPIVSPHGDSPHSTGSKVAANKEEIKIEGVEGSVTIEELFKNKEKYAAKEILVRGKVVKINLGIMNKNWIHIQDGTGTASDFDLTVTTIQEDLTVGDVVTCKGVITLNKDFGAGYTYNVIMEDASFEK